ncbi:multiple sugar transport system substrate-binding protein [Nonomuraea solani]|uniref:Multiple sugar transport system substrate-binding protein n=1 Tax=Nonomuraea solani TaxID=1144553 RepID=A0A1H6EDA4_9ACTN|nr:ABC transporter substrate-binding protein [Nonomuraea solani]SEG95780.1 multiple sugar transport system substrate-binding protein [Nonomuraea solani]
MSRYRRSAAGAVLLLLTGCGLGGGGTPPAEQAGDSLTVWFPGTNKTEIDLVTGTIVPTFEKETGAKVSVTFLDWPDLSTKLNAAFAAGSAPDVFGHGPAAVADFVKNDRLEPLTAYLAKLGAQDREDLANALPGGQVGGTQYLMPLSMQGNLIAYRAGDFTKAGLDPDKPPATWEALKEVAGKLTERAGGKITHAGLLLPSHPIGRQQTFASLLGSAGGTQLSADGKSAAFASPAGVKALGYFIDAYQGPGAVADQLGGNYQDLPTAQQPLVTGDASMTVLAPQAVQQMVKANAGLDIRVMPVPKFEGAEQGVAVGGAGPGLMINKDSARKELAWKFVSYMISTETSIRYTQGIGAIPARVSAAGSEYVKSSPVIQAFVEQAGHFRPNPNVPGWTQIRDTLSKHLEQALNKKTGAQEALTAAAAEVDTILKSE